MTVFIPSDILLTSALFLSLYQHLIKNRLKNITADLDAIGKDIIESKLGCEEEFLQVYSNNSKQIINYCRTLPFFYILSSSIFFCSVPIVDWFDGNYRTKFALNIDTPFEYKQPVIYEAIVLVMTGALSMSTGKLLNNAMFFLAFFNTLRSYLNFLYLSMDELQRKPVTSDDTRKNIRTWIKIHQEINRLVFILSNYYLLNYK